MSRRKPIHKLADDAIHARFRVTAPASQPLVPITAVVRKTPKKEVRTFADAMRKAHPGITEAGIAEAKKVHADGIRGSRPTTEKVSWPLKAPKATGTPAVGVSLEYKDKRGRWRTANPDGKLPEVNVQITACRITAPQMRLVEKVAVSKADWAALQRLIKYNIPNKHLRNAMLACRGDVVTVKEPNTMPLHPTYPKGKM